MTFNICGRRDGKTTLLVKLMLQNPRSIMVVPTDAMVHMTERNFPAIEGRVVSVRQVQGGLLKGMDIDSVHVDNLDLVLHMLLPVDQPFGVLTATGRVLPNDDSNPHATGIVE